MIIKFHNGYTVQVADCGSASRNEIFTEARKAVKAVIKAKDAELTKVVSTNVSFQPTKLELAYKTGDADSKSREIAYLMRDLEADLKHSAYPDAYTDKVLWAVIDKYAEAEKIIRKYDDIELADAVHEKIEELKKLWKLIVTTEDAIDEDGNELPGRFSIEYDVWDERIQDYVKIEEMFYGEALEDEEAYEKFNNDVVKKLKPGQKIKRRMLRWFDSKKVKDIPYYDPANAPRIKSSYSPDRISKEIAHSAEKDATLVELQEVFGEIDEFVERGREVLQDAGWTRDDARHAINERYYTFVNELKSAGLDDIAKALLEKINKLEKVWDLKR